MKECLQPDCIPDVTGCMYGYQTDTITKCKFYKSEQGQKAKTESKQETAQLIPWAGVSLGQRDIADLAASRSLSMFGIIGVQNSGKTTLLTLLYCLLRQGHKIGEYRFAGSLTLPAWETLAYYMTWKTGNHIAFPPHTPGSAGRIPGLLHLTLIDESGKVRDILITDAKGEWFKEWAVNAAAETAQSPVWIHNHSSAFALVADCEELAGPDRGTARDELKDLFNRLVNNLDDRPVALAWTKSDIPIRPAMKENLTEHLQISDSAVPDFMISAYKDKQDGRDESYWQLKVLSLFDYLLKATADKRAQLPEIVSSRPKDLFLSKRMR